MSTRATYRFADADQPTTTIYIHHDGYPDGAAMYLYNALVNQSKGNFATQFIRANAGAEITRSHEIHGDTEWRYDITGHGPDADLKVQQFLWDSGGWKYFYCGNLARFIHNNSSFLTDYTPFRQVKMQHQTIAWFNRDTARQYLHSKWGPLGNIAAWKGRFEGSANWNSSMEAITSILSEFPELRTAEVTAIIGEQVPS